MDELELLRDTAEALFRDHSTRDEVSRSEGDWSPMLWQRLTDAGFTGIGVDEAVGGLGGDTRAAAEIVLAAGRAAAPVPIAESMFVTGWLRSNVGAPHDDRPALSIDDTGLRVVRNGDAWTVSGHLQELLWGRTAAELLVVSTTAGGVISIGSEAVEVVTDANLAGEPRDVCHLADTSVGERSFYPGEDIAELRDHLALRAALARTLLMAGALERVAELTVQYTKEREQFGRPISSFQAVRQSAAQLVGHATLASTSARAAALTPADRTAVLAARVAVADAASHGTRIAHQLHGAIGFTRELPLHQLTRRLWAWRDEGRRQRAWTLDLGRHLLAQPQQSVWERVAT